MIRFQSAIPQSRTASTLKLSQNDICRLLIFDFYHFVHQMKIYLPLLLVTICLNSPADQLKNIQTRIDGLLMLQGQASNPDTLKQVLQTFEKLNKEKSVLEGRLIHLSDVPDRNQLIAESRRLIEERLQEFQRGFKKAPGAMKKRFLRRVLKQVVVSSEGLTIFMLLADQADIPNHQIQLIKDSGPSDESQSIGLTKKASGYDSNLLVLSSDIGKNGDSGTIRTYDPLLRREMLYPAELRNHGQWTGRS